MKARVLTRRQLRELDDHFRVRIPDPSKRLEAVRRIDLVFQRASLELQRPREWTEDFKRERERMRDHFQKVKEHAKALRALLGEHEPHPWKMSWGGLTDLLQLLETSAAEEEEEHKDRRGAPRVTRWRDDLIIVVHEAHPAGTPHEDIWNVVRPLLNGLEEAGLLEEDKDLIGDWKRTIQRALKRELTPSLRHMLEATRKQGGQQIRPELAELLHPS